MMILRWTTLLVFLQTISGLNVQLQRNFLRGQLFPTRQSPSRLTTSSHGLDPVNIISNYDANMNILQSIQAYLPSQVDHIFQNLVPANAFDNLQKLLPHHLFEGLQNLIPALRNLLTATLGLIVAAALKAKKENTLPEGKPYGYDERYDPQSAIHYFSTRPVEVISRTLEIAAKSSRFAGKILADFAFGKLSNPVEEAKRADELCELLTSLGPTFVKVGQSLSIRTDLLRPAYIAALSKLQDRVPSFPTMVAKKIIEDEFGFPAEELFASGLEDNASVVAAASLGQVFRARLKHDGSDVAVKVQRPNVLMNVALDMHILRLLAPGIKLLLASEADAVGIVDDWGRGFVDELNYYSEADNAECFTDAIKKTPFKDVVFAPEVIRECSSRRVLTTRWVEGERLEKSSAGDVSTLCSIAMSTYLTMLLETPILHCDPHPGNLRRTPDGRLCIMDWGLVTSVDPGIQARLITHISHVVSKDYQKIPDDLTILGFVPPGQEKNIHSKEVLDVLSDIYDKWGAGGGASKVDINVIIKQVSGLVDKFGSIFQMPPYFAYVLRAFTVLEGIGLTIDPNYSILKECLPYVSRRLLTDTHESTEDALQNFIFGPEKNDEDRVVDSERLKLLVKGFGEFSKSTGAHQDQKLTSSVVADQIDVISDQILDVIFSIDPKTSTPSALSTPVTPIQKIVVEQLGKVIAAGTRIAWGYVRDVGGHLPTGRSVVGTLVDPLGILEGSSILEIHDSDRRAVEVTWTLVELLQENLPISSLRYLLRLNPFEVHAIASSLLSKIWSRRSQLGITSFLLLSELIKQASKRIQKQPVEGSNDISSNAETYFLPKNEIESARAAKAKALLSMARSTA